MAPRILTVLALLLLAGCRSTAEWDLPYGSPAEVAYAGRLWSALQGVRMVGPESRPAEPFYGGAKPHGEYLELHWGDVTVDGHTGFVVVKKNYDGAGVSETAVARDRARFLSSITVMFRRAAGYDADNQDWFWVKYGPGGALFSKTVGTRDVALAGRIAKGKAPESNTGCIYCHASAGGRDYIFYPQIKRPRP